MVQSLGLKAFRVCDFKVEGLGPTLGLRLYGFTVEVCRSLGLKSGFVLVLDIEAWLSQRAL